MALNQTKKIASSQIANARGGLLLPENTRVLYAEPGILFKAKKGSYLFEKPPQHEKSSYKKELKTETVKITDKVSRLILHRKTKQAHEEALIVDIQFEGESDVIARPFEYQDPKHLENWIKHPFLIQVATFERIGETRPELPESGNEVKIKKLGYMYKEDLLQQEEKFNKIKEDLFPKMPSTADVRQAGMGNCFFLSSLMSILARDQREDTNFEGTNFIMNMMKQEEDGTTIVRLYDPRTLEPVYVRVENSYHYISSDSAVAHKAPWVHILEKAYAGLGFTKYQQGEKYQSIIGNESETKYAITSQSFLSIYGGGGQEELSLTILTGKRANRKILQGTNKTNFFDFDSRKIIMGYAASPLADELHKDQEFLNKAKRREDFDDVSRVLKDFLAELATFQEQINSENWKNSNVYNALGGDKNLIVEWTVYINLLCYCYNDTYSQFKKITDPNEGTKSPPYVIKDKSDLLLMINKLEELDPPPPKAVMNAFKQYAIGKKIDDQGRELYHFNGKVGSGEYTNDQYELFDELSKLYKAGHILTASTLDHFPEKEIKGLRPQHAYAITRVYKKKIKNKELMFVRLRNPWGTTGRMYDFEKNEALESKAHAEFDLDISEFKQYFSTFTNGTLSPPLSVQQKVTPTEEAEEKNRQQLNK